MMVIINDILDFSKIESGKLSLELLDFDLPTFLDRLLALFGERAQRKGLLLTSRIAEDVPSGLCGDPARLQQILSNLLANAIKLRLLGDRVSRRTAWKIAREHGWENIFDAEYLAVCLLQADALITIDETLAAKAAHIVPLATLGALVG